MDRDARSSGKTAGKRQVWEPCFHPIAPDLPGRTVRSFGSPLSAPFGLSLGGPRYNRVHSRYTSPSASHAKYSHIHLTCNHLDGDKSRSCLSARMTLSRSASSAISNSKNHVLVSVYITVFFIVVSSQGAGLFQAIGLFLRLM